MAGLRADGSIQLVGDDGSYQQIVSEWTDIVDFQMGDYEIFVGLKSDGTISHVVNSDMWAGNMLQDMSGWKDIVKIFVVTKGVIGVKSDGTVVASGYGQYTNDWSDVVQVVSDWNNTRGLKADGTVLSIGSREFGARNTSDWTDIVASITMEYCFRADGTLVHGDREKNALVADWTDMLTVAAGANHLAGLKTDGTAVASGNTQFGQCHVYDLRHIQLPRKPENQADSEPGKQTD